VTKLLSALLTLTCLTFSACKTKPGLGSSAAGASAPAPAATGSLNQGVPIASLLGKVASARGDLKFVVVDFSPNQVPAVGTRLNVYRDGQKVGELQISGPAEASNIAADIIAGKAQAGDAVRMD